MAEKQATKPTTNGAVPADQFPSEIVRVLQGVTIAIPTKFKPGHKLSYEEAFFCSTMHAAAVRSAFEDTAKALRDPNRVDEAGKKLGAASDEEVRAAFASYADSYTWSPRGEATPTDPIEAEVRRIARAELQNFVKAGKFAWPEGKDKREFALTAYIGKYETRLRKQAQDNLAKMPALDESFLAQLQGPGA